MKVYIQKNKLTEVQNKRGILERFDQKKPAEVLGVLKYIGISQDTVEETYRRTYLLCVQHHQESTASFTWARMRITHRSHVWIPKLVHTTLEDLEEKEDTTPVMWIPEFVTMPAENRFAKNVLDKYDC